MRKINQTLRDSLQEFRHIRALCAMGMLGALAIIIDSFTIPIGDVLKIGFSTECNAIVDCLFGPAAGAFFSAAIDILKFLVKPNGTYFFGFTFDAAVAGLIMGFGFYKKKITFLRVFTVRLINSLVVNVLLATCWLNVLYGKGFLALLPTRLLKNIIMVPIESMIFFTIYKALGKSGIISMIRHSKKTA